MVGMRGFWLPDSGHARCIKISFWTMDSEALRFSMLTIWMVIFWTMDSDVILDVLCFSAAGAIMVIAVADAIGSPDYVVTASPYTFVLFLRLLDRVARRFARCLGIAGDEE